MPNAMRSLLLITACALIEGSPVGEMRNPDAVVFPDQVPAKTDHVITPPVLPRLQHLDRDPSTLTARALKSESDSRRSRDGVKPRFGPGGGFDVTRGKDGGFSATFTNGFSGSSSQSQSHSVSANFNQGFQLSQSSSQSNSFGSGQFGSSGSVSSSQSSSFSGGSHGVSSASSASSAIAGNVFGSDFSSSSAHSNSAASGFGLTGPSSAFGQSSGVGSSFGGQSFGLGQSSSGSFGSGAISQAAGSGYGSSQGNLAASHANAQSMAGLNGWNGLKKPVTSVSGANAGGFSNGNIGISNTNAAASSIVFPEHAGFDDRLQFNPIPTVDPRTSYGRGRGRQSPNRWRSSRVSEQTISFGNGDLIKFISF